MGNTPCSCLNGPSEQDRPPSLLHEVEPYTPTTGFRKISPLERGKVRRKRRGSAGNYERRFSLNPSHSSDGESERKATKPLRGHGAMQTTSDLLLTNHRMQQELDEAYRQIASLTSEMEGMKRVHLELQETIDTMQRGSPPGPIPQQSDETDVVSRRALMRMLRAPSWEGNSTDVLNKDAELEAAEQALEESMKRRRSSLRLGLGIDGTQRGIGTTSMLPVRVSLPANTSSMRAVPQAADTPASCDGFDTNSTESGDKVARQSPSPPAKLIEELDRELARAKSRNDTLFRKASGGLSETPEAAPAPALVNVGRRGRLERSSVYDEL